MNLRNFKHEFHFKGGGGTPTVIQQVAPTAPTAPTPAPPTKGDAAHNISPYGLARAKRQGRSGSILAPRGTLEDQITSLLGISGKLGG
jgi:hypothetical protein